MSGKKKVNEVTYMQIVGAGDLLANALNKITNVYIPDVMEMSKLNSLTLEFEKAQKSYEVELKKIRKGIEEEYDLSPFEPKVKGKPTEEEVELKKERVKQIEELKKEINVLVAEKIPDLLECSVSFNPKKAVIKMSAIQEAMDRESKKEPRNVRRQCPECNAVVQIVDLDRNLLKPKDLAALSEYIEFKPDEKGNKKKK